MEIKYLLDTNFIIHYLTQREDCVKLFSEILSNSFNVFISVMTVTELLSSSKLNAEDIEIIQKFISQSNIIYLDSSIAVLGGEVRRKIKIKTPDALIASTCLFYD